MVTLFLTFQILTAFIALCSVGIFIYALRQDIHSVWLRVLILSALINTALTLCSGYVVFSHTIEPLLLFSLVLVLVALIFILSITVLHRIYVGKGHQYPVRLSHQARTLAYGAFVTLFVHIAVNWLLF